MKKKRKGATKQSSAAAAYKRGEYLYYEKNDPDTALKYFIKAAKAGYTKAYGEIGIILHREKNEPEEAERWFIKAERSNSLFPAARYEYGMLYYLSKEDWETGLKYLLESADQEYELAYGDIGSIVYVYQEKIDEAEEWFKKAEQSDCLFAPAAHDYGILLWLGKGKLEDSFKYFKKSAEEGFEPAYGQLGTIYYLEKLDIDEAESWFEKAKKAGCLDAPQAYDYGMLLIEERGEIEEGKKYLKMAEEGGYFDEGFG
jgi:TPR repeat protein